MTLSMQFGHFGIVRWMYTVNPLTRQFSAIDTILICERGNLLFVFHYKIINAYWRKFGMYRRVEGRKNSLRSYYSETIPFVHFIFQMLS